MIQDPMTEAVKRFHAEHPSVGTTTAFLLGYTAALRDMAKASDRCGGIKVIEVTRPSSEVTP